MNCETGRQTGNKAFRASTRPTGPISRKLHNVALKIKIAAGRIVDHPGAVDELMEAANSILDEAKRVEGLELQPLWIGVDLARPEPLTLPAGR